MPEAAETAAADTKPAATPVEAAKPKGKEAPKAGAAAKHGPQLNADGTYAQTASIVAAKEGSRASTTRFCTSRTLLCCHAEKTASTSRERQSNLRVLLIDGDYFLAASLANSLTKLLLRFSCALCLAAACDFMTCSLSQQWLV